MLESHRSTSRSALGVTLTGILVCATAACGPADLETEAALEEDVASQEEAMATPPAWWYGPIPVHGWDGGGFVDPFGPRPPPPIIPEGPPPPGWMGGGAPGGAAGGGFLVGLAWAVIAVEVVILGYEIYLIADGTIDYYEAVAVGEQLDAQLKAYQAATGGNCNPGCGPGEVCSMQNVCITGSPPGGGCASNSHCLSGVCNIPPGTCQ